MRKVLAGLLWATVAGVLYGAITVTSKAAHAPPLAKACIGSLASGLTLAPALQGLQMPRRDWGRFATMVVFGGVLAPGFILYGLQTASALHAGLLLTLELVVTAALGFVVLRERAGWRAAAGLAVLLCAAVASSLSGSGEGSKPIGLLLVALAALAFAVDNTASTLLTGNHRPPQLVAAKSLLALLLLVPAWAIAGGGFPQAWTDWALLVAGGSLGVGLGSVAFYRALRSIGAARTSAVNVPVSALAAAAGGWLVLREPAGWVDGVAIAFVAAGIGLLWEPGSAAQGGGRRMRKASHSRQAS